MKPEKRIPTILGLVLLLATIYSGSFLVKRQASTYTQASGDCEPINPQVSNITYNSATVSFTTSSSCLATVSLSNRTFTDSKDKGTVHYFDLVALEESKAYIFTIISGGKNFSSDSYNFKTAKKPTKDIPTSNLAWGKVLNPDGKVASNAIIYFSITGASPLSALVNSSGNWNIALSTSFNESLNDWFTPPSNIEENITVIAPSFNQTQIVSNTSHNNPVPDITIGKNDFSTTIAVTPTTQETSSESLMKTTNSDLVSSSSLSISNPKNNENVSSKRPDFFGTAKAKSKLTIKVESPVVINGETETKSDGSWHWSPSQDLTPGEHTITITDDTKQTISRKFIVLAAESQTSFTASPSAITPTTIPTLIPTQIPVVKPSTSSGVPRTGTSLPTLLLISLSLISVTFAFVYYKKS